MGLLLLLLYSHHANVNNPQSVPYPAAQKPDIRDRLIGEYRLAPNLSPSLASLQYLLVTRPIIMPASQLSGKHSCFRGRPILYAMRAPHPSIMSPASSIPKTQNKDRRLPAACIPWPVPTTSKKVFGDVAGECVLRKPNRVEILQGMVLGSRGVYPISSRSSSMLLCLNTKKCMQRGGLKIEIKSKWVVQRENYHREIKRDWNKKVQTTCCCTAVTLGHFHH